MKKQFTVIQVLSSEVQMIKKNKPVLSWFPFLWFRDVWEESTTFTCVVQGNIPKEGDKVQGNDITFIVLSTYHNRIVMYNKGKRINLYCPAKFEIL